MSFLRGLIPTALLLAALGVAGVAAAATGTATGSWTFGGAAGAYTGTVTLPGVGFPAATFTSDSHGGNAVGVQSGQSTWFGPTTPPGLVFGSSQGQPYVGLAAKSDTGAGAPSTTTFTFASATPGGWGFVLGDIDADKVAVSGVRADGSAASTADLGFQGAFNFCTSTPRPSPCPSTDVPAWDSATGTLTGSGADTTGASGWFRPAVPLKTLTLSFVKTVPGSPTFQVWFAQRTQDVTGTVRTTSGPCDPTTARVDLVGPSGAVVASTTPAPDGTYAFTGVAASSGFTVRVGAPPTGCAATGAGSVPVDLTSADGTADFDVHRVTARIDGVVRDPDGGPVPDVVVSARADGHVVGRDRTSSGGTFALPALPPGTYAVTADPPGDDVVVGGPTRHVTITADGTVPRLRFSVRPAEAATSTAQTSTAEPVASTGALPEVGGHVPPWLPATGLASLIIGLGLLGSDHRHRLRTGD